MKIVGIIGMNRLLLKMLHSATGLYLTGYMIFHLYSNSYARLGRDAYDQMALGMIARPYIHVLEMALIFLPLAFHGFYGLCILYRGSDNLIRQSCLLNWFYSIQRWTGAAILLFLFFHVTLFRMNRPARAISFQDLAIVLQSPWAFYLTLSGCLLVSFHVTVGLWNAGINWGLLIGPVSQKRALKVLSGFGLVLFLWAWDIVRAFN